MHSNSKEAYRAIVGNGSKASRSKSIIQIFENSKAPLSDHQVLQKFKLGSDNLNLVRPRITELHQSGILIEGPQTKSTEGNLNVRTSFIDASIFETQGNLFW